jgi:hypothetical protein
VNVVPLVHIEEILDVLLVERIDVERVYVIEHGGVCGRRAIPPRILPRRAGPYRERKRKETRFRGPPAE